MCETLEVLKNIRKWFFNGLSVPWPTSVEMVSWCVWHDIFRPVTHSFLCQSHCWQFRRHYLYMCLHFPFHSVNLSIYMFFHIINIWRLTGKFIMNIWLNTQLHNGIAHILGIDCTQGWQMFTCDWKSHWLPSHDWKVTLVAITGSTVHAGWLLAPSRRHFLPLPLIPHISRLAGPLNIVALEILQFLAIEISCYYYLRFLVRLSVSGFPCLISSNFTCMSVVVLEVVFPVSLETVRPGHLKQIRMTDLRNHLTGFVMLQKQR